MTKGKPLGTLQHIVYPTHPPPIWEITLNSLSFLLSAISEPATQATLHLGRLLLNLPVCIVNLLENRLRHVLVGLVPEVVRFLLNLLRRAIDA